MTNQPDTSKKPKKAENKTTFKTDAPAEQPASAKTRKKSTATPIKSTTEPVINIQFLDPNEAKPVTNARTVNKTNNGNKDQLKLAPPNGAKNGVSKAKPAAKKAPAKPISKAPLVPGRWHEILGIILITVGAVFFIGMFASNTAVGNAALFIRQGIGLMGYFVPPLVIFIGMTLIWEGVRRQELFSQARTIGGFFLIIAVTSFLHLVSANPKTLAETGGGAGWFGYYFTGILSGALTGFGAFLVLLAMFLIGIMIAFNISFRDLANQFNTPARPNPAEMPRYDFDDFDEGEDYNVPPAIPKRTANVPPSPATDDEFLEDLLKNGVPQTPPSLPAPVASASLETKEGLRIGGFEKWQRPSNQKWERDPNAANPVPPSLSNKEWLLPDINILTSFAETEINEKELTRKARIIEETLMSFGVEAKVKEVNVGPTVTQFALEPGFGVKVARITSLSNDIALALAAKSIRIEAPVPGQSRVGIEVPNAKIATVGLREIMETEEFLKPGKLKIAMGRDVAGQPMVTDLAKMPHLLIAGSTGSGKSVFLNSVITAYLLQYRPSELKFIMVDPKMVELIGYNGIPHLQFPVVTQIESDPDKEEGRKKPNERVPTVMSVLKWSIREMERRYKHFSATGHRNIESYNKVAGEGNSFEKLPYIVIIVDELADLMMVAPDEVEASICRLAQKARAVGLHLILATQRPSVDVVTGLIKANFPTRITFAVTSQMDSRVILDSVGAEKLLGRGDMLYLPSDAPKPIRIQGVFVGDNEIDLIVKFWRDQNNFISGQNSNFVQPELIHEEPSEREEREEEYDDELFETALEIIRENRTASVSLLQRRLRIGYNRAALLIKSLEDAGVIAKADGGKPRPVLLEEEDFREPASLTAIAQSISLESAPTTTAPRNNIKIADEKPVLNSQARRNQDRVSAAPPPASAHDDEDDDPPL
jgi:S-DNA-T family DNA segregation ATPase FtsK/SpoIIIE